MKEFITDKLEQALDKEKLEKVVLAFRYLILADPSERHFALRFCNFDEGRGCEIWCMIDEYSEDNGELTVTYLLPKDY